MSCHFKKWDLSKGWCVRNLTHGYYVLEKFRWAPQQLLSARGKFQKLNRRLLLLIALTRYFLAYSKKFASFENVGWLFEVYLALFKTFLLYKLFWYLLHKSTSNQRPGKKIRNWISPRVAYSNFYSIQNLISFYAKVNKIKHVESKYCRLCCKWKPPSRVQSSWTG